MPTPTLIHLSINYYNGKISIIVIDNGIGFNINTLKQKKGIGMKSIQDRVLSLGGEMIIKSEIKKGTSIRISISDLNKYKPLCVNH